MTEATTTEKKKRNQGPVAVMFGNGEKNDAKRVIKGVTSVVIKTRTGELKTFDLSQIPSEHLAALAAVAFASKAKGYINNHAKEDESKVIALADEVWADFVAGNIYSEAKEGKTAKGGKRGRQFDATMYVEAYRRAKESQNKAKVLDKAGNVIQLATEKQLDSLKTQLVAMTGPDRTKKIKSMMENPVFKKHYLAVQAAAIKIGKEDNTNIDDMGI